MWPTRGSGWALWMGSTRLPSERHRAGTVAGGLRQRFSVMDVVAERS